MSAEAAAASAANGDAASLAVEELVAGYGEVIALDGVTLAARAAGITAVLGANGAGKTTLLRAISGLIKPRRGRILLADHDVAGRNPEQMVRTGIAHVPEGQGVIPELTVEENLRIGMMSWRGNGRSVRPRSRRSTPASSRWPTAGASWPPRCPAASGRCW